MTGETSKSSNFGFRDSDQRIASTGAFLFEFAEITSIIMRGICFSFIFA